MRVLKTVIIILFVLTGLWLVISFFAPGSTDVRRSTVINARPETIYSYISHLKNMDEWGVWRKTDKDARFEATGEDGAVGYKVSWDGDTVHQGSQTITALEPNKSVQTDLAFGDFMVSRVSLDLTPVENGTEVTWSLKNDIPFHWRALMMFAGMGSGVERDFDQGLANLKTICEARQLEADKTAAQPRYTINTTDRPAMLYVGKREVVKWADMMDFFARNFSSGMATIAKAGVKPTAAPTGVYFEWNERDHTADMIAGIPVALASKGKLKGAAMYQTPASKALIIDYTGGYSNMAPAHGAMQEYMKTNNLSLNANVVEEYVTGPGSEPDSTKWHTNIIYLIK